MRHIDIYQHWLRERAQVYYVVGDLAIEMDIAADGFDETAY